MISVGEGAFSYCQSLCSVELSENIVSIGKQAFSNCESLTSIVIPDGVISIGRLAFNNCISLSSITIPDSVSSIESGAFSVINQNWEFSNIPSLTITVTRDSYAVQYCKDNNIPYVYSDANDWLNN